MAITLAVVSAIRFDVGWDYANYFNVLIRGKDYLWSFIMWEPLNQLAVIFTWIVSYPQLFFMAYSFLTIFFVWKGIREITKDAPLALLIYFFVPLFYLESLTLVRQHLAISIVFYAITFLIEAKYIKYAILVILASLIHFSAIIAFTLLFLPLTSILNRKLELLAMITTFLFGAIISTYIIGLIPFYGTYVQDGAVFGEGGKLSVPIINLVSIVLWFFKDRLIEIDSRNRFNFKVLFLGILVLNVLSPFGHAGIRSFMYFSVVLLSIFSTGPRLFKEMRLPTIGLMLALFMVFLAYIKVSDGNESKSPYIPYKVYWNKSAYDLE